MGTGCQERCCCGGSGRAAFQGAAAADAASWLRLTVNTLPFSETSSAISSCAAVSNSTGGAPGTYAGTAPVSVGNGWGDISALLLFSGAGADADDVPKLLRLAGTVRETHGELISMHTVVSGEAQPDGYIAYRTRAAEAARSFPRYLRRIFSGPGILA